MCSEKYDKFVKLIRRFKLTQSLVKVSAVSYFLEEKGKNILKTPFQNVDPDTPDVYVTQTALSFVSSQFIISANEHREKSIDHDNLLLLNNWYTSLDEEYREEGDISGVGSIIRSVFNQFPCQAIGGYQFFRSVYFLNKLSERTDLKNKIDH